MSKLQTVSESDLQNGELSDTALAGIHGGKTALGELAKVVVLAANVATYAALVGVSAVMGRNAS